MQALLLSRIIDATMRCTLTVYEEPNAQKHYPSTLAASEIDRDSRCFGTRYSVGFTW